MLHSLYMSYVPDVAMFTVWLVFRECDIGDRFPAGCLVEDNDAFCVCKTELCNTGVHQPVSWVGHEIIVSCVTVAAVVGRIFYY